MTKNRGRRVALTATAVVAFASVAGAISAASGPERSLAGITIFAPGSQVTKKFGNPSRILVGGIAPAAGSMVGGGAAAGGGYPGGGGGGYPGGVGGGYPGGGGGAASEGGRGPQMSGMSLGGGAPAPSGGSLPGFGGGYPGGGGGYPGGGGGYPGGGGGYPGGGGADANGAALPGRQTVTLIYDRALGGDLEFTISPDKRVVQIRETGYSGAYGTARNIKLGTTYSQVVARYGSPENHSIAGSILNVDYRDTLHCGFQFLDQKLVGIIVSAPD